MTAPSLPDSLRDHLAVSFDLVRLVGEGGMGVVWLGHDRLLDREVAIKVLRRDPASGDEGERRFLQEARLAARLQHPGIVPLLTFGEVGEHRYYVMPFMRGETLAERIRRGPIPESETRRIVAEVADALEYVHAQGIVHRDVKPANILIEEGSGRALITDFGIARRTDNATLTATGMIVGTPLYLAPEQATGGAEAVDGRADLYALGIVAWEALTGRSPFAGASPQEIIARKMTDGIPSVREAAPTVAPSLANAVSRATAMNTTARWSRASDFAAALRMVDDADPDPAELRPLRSAASLWLVAGTPAMSLLLYGLSTVPREAGLLSRMLMPPLVATLVSAMFAFGRSYGLRAEHAPKRPWRELFPVLMRPPRAWFALWPRRWRGFDVTDHLPDWVARPLRRFRLTNSVMLAVLIPMYGWMAMHVVATPEEMARVMQLPIYGFIQGAMMWMLIPVFGSMVVGIVPLERIQKRLIALGLTRTQRVAISERQYDASILREPHMRTLLSEIQAPVSQPRDLPSLVADLAAIAGQLREAGWQLDDLAPFIDEARLADAQWAREAGELASDADPLEAARLRDRLAKLRGTGVSAPHQEEMSRLLEQQLALHERALARGHSVQARRDRLRDGCGLLWRQLRALRADDVRRADSSEITGRLRALAVDLQQLRAGADEVDTVLVDGAAAVNPRKPENH